MQPGTQPLGLPQRIGLAGQHEERRLESVLGVVGIAEHSLTDAQHHRPMPRHQRGEGPFGLLGPVARDPIQ